ncbi:aminotransferase class I/II-fold pyridoxal phosphate-dependent enzyme [Lysinibacillus telephonicus]|uniref:Aminotransferase n=2 Tax=Bacillaceae TaxID=186817 RepID=A0A3S0JSM8_9BACI|nr:aminotransferase class I/II-fold pyridoxal phosphate-dependent enzyme [Lysinibacillus telephonicus]RTQ96277.1 pyridoxal phosphate-dependent class II aminotransferase [Lysinibacillus telephonicus]
MQYPSHGANSEALYKRFGIDMPDKVWDLSENVNFHGYPNSFHQLWPSLLEKVSQYPDETAEPLRSLLAKEHHIPVENIVVGNGASELLMCLARLYERKKVLVIHPSFSEYERTLKQSHVETISIVVEDIITYQLPVEKIKAQMEKATAVYLCSPNNPTGVVIPKHILKELIIHGMATDCDVVVDEAFMDWTDENESIVSLTSQFPNLIVLRSMTKMYALAGIRLGYLIGQKANEIKRYLPHWNVNQLAVELGIMCLKEHEFKEMSKQSIIPIREELKRFLIVHDCIVTNSQVNFLSFQLPKSWDAKSFYFDLIRKGIVLRHTENFKGMDGSWLRIAIKDQQTMEMFKKGFRQYAKDNHLFSSSWGD